MQQPDLKNLSFISLSIALLSALGLGVFGQWRLAAGTAVSALWMFLNVVSFAYILAMAAAKVRTKRLAALLFLKFPALYLAGFFILTSRFFPGMGILAGMTIFLAAFGILWPLAARPEAVKKSFLFLALALIGGATFAFASPATEARGAHPAEATAHAEAAAHDERHGEHGGGLHTTNLIGFVSRYLPEPAAKFLSGIENVFFGSLVILVLAGIFWAASRRLPAGQAGANLVPGRLQAACESVVEGLNGFVCGILGPEGGKYTPFLGTLFLYIWTMNLIGLVPLMKSNTANSITLQGPVALPVPTTTVALALIVFVTVQAIGIKKQGLVGYLDHMAGAPRDVFGWVMVPLMFPIHLIGELAKPFSLTFRLFCNIMGGHILVAVFIGMGVAAMFIPFQAPFLIFEIATSTIQAFVFTLLSTVYIAMMLPHGHDESHAPAEAHAHSH